MQSFHSSYHSQGSISPAYKADMRIVLKIYVSKFRGEGEARCVYPSVVRVCQHRSEAESARACIYDIIVIPLEVLAVVLEQQFDVPAIV